MDGGSRLAVVAPMRWEAVTENGEETHVCDTVVGRYAAWEKAGVGRLIRPGDLHSGAAGASAEEARAAAWKDYEGRILGALVGRS